MQETKFLVKFSSGVTLEMNKNKKFKKYVDKCLSKFIKCNWGVIPKKDKRLNKLIIENNTEIPIVGIYNSFRFGKVIIVENFEYDCLYMSEIKVDKEFEITRNFEGIKV